jgi:hypothetical protein
MKKRSPYPAIPHILIMVFLAGCVWQHEFGPESPHYLPPVGSQLAVIKPIAIRANKASAWLQDGEIRAHKEIDSYYPNCKFELNTVINVNRTIEPGSFAIIHVYQEEQSMVRPTIRLAASFRLGVGIGGILAGGDGGPSPIPYATVFNLHSDAQPDVLRMTCMHWEDPTDARFLTLSEIRQALGDYISIIIE